MKKASNTPEALPNPVKTYVLKHPTNGYFCGHKKGYQYWSMDLNDARKWNRPSDAVNSKNKSTIPAVSESTVVPVTFTHGFQAIV